VRVDKGQSGLRVLFDENMSNGVAMALRLLGKDVKRTPATREGQEPTPDFKVARGSRSQGRVLFTNNFDCVVAATQEDCRVIWFYDKNQNSPTLFSQAWLFFRKWDDWEARFADESCYCIRVSMSRTTEISKEKAFKQANSLHIRRERKRQQIDANKDQLRMKFDD